MSRIKIYKPTTPARRKTSVVDHSSTITASKPYKKLTYRQKGNAGRNSRGKITVRHRGGGARRLVRIVDFKRNFPKGFKVNTIEYDPTRTAFVCLVTDIHNGQKSYILYTEGMKVGQKYNMKQVDLNNGNTIAIKDAPVGTLVSQIELKPGQGAKLVRSAGTYAVVTARADGFVTIKLPSGELRKVKETCKCVYSRIGNTAHSLVRVGKAGRKRHMGIRPTVRGKVMNPVDHPHGGGEARNSIGMKYPKTPWGKHALGVKTRKLKKKSDKYIVKRRK